MKYKKISIIAVMALFFLAGCTAYESSAAIYEIYDEEHPYELYALYKPIVTEEDAENDTKQLHKNPFFFPAGTTIVTYESSYWTCCHISGNINLHVSLIKEIDEGYLYALQLDQPEKGQIGCIGGYVQMSSERLHLGFFYVTPETIYRRRAPQDFTDYADSAISMVIEEVENQIMDDWAIVSSNDTIGHVAIDGQWRSFVEIEGNRRIFRLFSVDSFHGATRFYERFVWEEGKGIVLYFSGWGAMRDHMEINLPDTDAAGGLPFHMETFVNILQNKRVFTYVMPWRANEWGAPTMEPMFLNDFLVHHVGADDYTGQVTHFALLDMDGEGQPVVVLAIWPGGGRLVLHNRNGIVHGTSSNSRSMQALTTDGTFLIHGGAGSGAIARLRFAEWGYAEHDIIYSWDSRRSQGTYTATHYFNGELVSPEELDESVEHAWAYFFNKEEIVWHPFDEDWVEKLYSRCFDNGN